MIGIGNKRGTRSAGQHQLERIITSHHVRSRSPENQHGAEGAMGKAQDSQAEADDVSGSTQKDRGGSKSKVGEGEERGVENQREPGR
jgi:hypothetical protein